MQNYYHPKDVNKPNQFAKQIESIVKKIKKIKYPVQPVSIVRPLSTKTNQLPIEVSTKLTKLTQNLNCHRQIRGDGNCFFRAFAFMYISNLKTVDYKKCFSQIETVKLTSCLQSTIPKDFLPFYSEHLLQQLIKQFWNSQYKFFLQYAHGNYKRALARLLTENHFLDFIIILYFRSVCLQAYRLNKSQIKDFLFRNEEQQIKTYGAQSQSLLINLCSNIFYTDTIVYELRKNEVIKYQYNRQSTYTINLLFYDNHYDIIQRNDNWQEEEKDLKEQIDLFGEINKKKIKGFCLQCHRSTDIYQETGLCINCFDQNLQKLNHNQPDSFEYGFCIECKNTKSKISKKFNVCQKCIDRIQQYSNQIEKELVFQDKKKKSFSNSKQIPFQKLKNHINQSAERPKKKKDFDMGIKEQKQSQNFDENTKQQLSEQGQINPIKAIQIKLCKKNIFNSNDSQIKRISLICSECNKQFIKILNKFDKDILYKCENCLNKTALKINEQKKTTTGKNHKKQNRIYLIKM